MSEPTFTCAQCHGVFERGWSEEEAVAERDTLWADSESQSQGFDVVCDDCFRKFMGWFQHTNPDHPAADLYGRGGAGAP